MKRSRLIFAVAVSLAGLIHTVQALQINPDGTGQVLIYPYYTVNANNSTLLSVVNATAKAKVVKVRLLEGYNGQDVLNFNLFLSRFDVWTGSIFSLVETEGGNLLTDDESCTIPDIMGAEGPGLLQLPAPDGRSYVPLHKGQYQTDGGPQAISRTREGHIELIEMATIVPGSALESAVTHNMDSVPAGCTNLTATLDANRADLARPTGGLFGAAIIVNPTLGTLIGYNADAIDGFYQLPGNLYTFSGSAYPNLKDARTTETTVVAYNYAPTTADGPSNAISSSYDVAHAIDAVSSLFAAETISNEYVVEAVSASESEWVVTFPTKNYYVNQTPATAPFLDRFAAPGQSCTKFGAHFNDREEREPHDPFDCGFICLAMPPVHLCYESNVLTFQKELDYAALGGVSPVLGSKLTFNVDPRAEGFTSGWMRMDLNPNDALAAEPHALRVSGDGDIYHGLPVTGFLATNYLNRNNGGPNVLSTYSTSGRHRASRNCTNATTGGNGFCS
ncbi:MAG: hypothetical protein ABI411_11000 [Tahibacter sp.]